MLMLGVFLMGGFVITKQSVQPWVIWLYWISPMQVPPPLLFPTIYGFSTDVSC